MIENLRVAIIGAGPAGLSAAEALKERGCQHVVIYEKRPRVGGQALSKVFVTKGGDKIVYELGSIQPASMPHILKLIKKYQLHRGRGSTVKNDKIYKYYDGKTRTYLLDYKKSIIGYPMRYFLSFVADTIKILKKLWQFKRLREPGFQNTPHLDELSIPLEQWIDQQHFSIVADRLKLTLIGMGAGGMQETAKDVPIFYGVKFIFQYLYWPFRYLNGSYLPITEGYQTLWERVAESHTIKLSAKITEIHRENNQIIISTDDSQEAIYDMLIIACPADYLKNVINYSQNEMALHSKIRYSPLWKGSVIIKNYPRDQVTSFFDSYFNDKSMPIGFLIPEGQVDQNSCLYTFGAACDHVQKTDFKQSVERYLKNHFNAEVVEWLDLIYWSDYHASFLPVDVKSGIFDELEKIQGLQNTWYVGGVYGGHGHACVVQYSYSQVNKMLKSGNINLINKSG